MPKFSRVQPVLLELALALAACGLVGHGGWRIVGLAAGAVLLLCSVVPVRGRWLYQLAASWVTMIRRKQSVRGPGLQSLLGSYRVITVPGKGRGARFAVVQVGSTWALPLELVRQGDEHDVPLQQLESLLSVEDIPVASVRLLTVATPLRYPSGGRRMSRYCVLTVDAVLAADAVASRGGSDAAIQQILRRCALRAEQLLESVGINADRLDSDEVGELFLLSIGANELRRDGPIPPTVESWREVRVAGTWSTTLEVSGAQHALAPGVHQLISGAPTQVAVSSVLLERGRKRGEVSARTFLRLSGPGNTPDWSAVGRAIDYARVVGLTLQRLDGRQTPLLAATTPVGVGGGALTV